MISKLSFERECFNINKTIEHYSKTFNEYCNGSAGNEKFQVDIKDDFYYRSYKAFLDNISGNKILEIGSATTRDAQFFRSKGFEVECVEPVEEFYNLAIQNNFKAYNTLYENTNFNNKYNGIWAHASIIHIKKQLLPNVFTKVHTALQPNGIFFLSLRKDIGVGELELETNGMYFNFITLELLDELIKDKFNIIDLWNTEHRHGLDNTWYSITLCKI
ncbi:MAG: methyltransferase domain-containing protein [bacterium]